jgi:exodeoxyribonuclease-3
MLIATWNLNSIRARLERLRRWITAHRPDVLCLQELKVQDANFPHEAIENLGYRAAVHGQKTYNGVAILARADLKILGRGLDDGDADPQARLIAAQVAGLDVLSAYVPNGAEVGTDKYAYKLRWMERLRNYLDKKYRPDSSLLVCGDFNVAPEDQDVAEPEQWKDTVLCHEQARSGLANLCDFGLIDLFRLHVATGGHYSWWDYRMLAFPKNHGLRIDLILATAPIASRCKTAWIDRDERKGKQPSDHAPVLVELT